MPPMNSPPFGWSRAAAAGLAFRRMADADLPFLARLYASTRMEELSVLDWSDAQRAAFLQMQFNAQHTHYQKFYSAADFLVIEHGGQAVGRLYLGRFTSEHCIVDIAFLPEHRRKGLGTALLRDLLDEAAAAHKAVTIHVEKYNPAHALYRRLGFTPVAEQGVYDQMRWDAGE